MDEKTVRVGEWRVPSSLFEEYLKFSMMADKYLLNKLSVPSNTAYERNMRWSMCVQKVMEIHRKICSEIGIEYSSSIDDPFYSEFHKEVQKQLKLKG